MVKGLTPQREFMSTSPAGAVYFFSCELLIRAIYYKILCSKS